MSKKKDKDWWNPNPKCYCVLCHCNVNFDDPDKLAEHVLMEHAGS